jgi:acyl-CoA thioesterase FadM
MEFGMFRAGTDDVVGNGSTVVAWTDLAAGRVIALPEDVRALLAGAPPGAAQPPAP